jgi:hypothetical protein
MNRVRFLIFLTLLCSVVELSAQFTPCNWKFRKRITFDPTKVSGATDLTDFPALITFTADADMKSVGNGGHVESSSGYDIVFTLEDGVTQLNHDLGGYSATTGSLTAWVKIPDLSVSFNTYIYMYYGNSAITTDQSSTSTWSNGYVGVWHFNNSLNNSTGTSGLNGTNAGSTNTATGMFNEARNFARSSTQYVNVTPYNSAYDLTSEITVSAWINLASIGVDQKVAGNQNNTTGGWKFGVFSDNKIELEIRTSGNSPFLSRSASGGSTLGTGTWYYAVGMYSDAGNYIRTYRNGTLDRNYGTTASLGTSNGTMKFGCEPFQTNSANWDGIMDEVRVSNVARTAAWVATEYANQSSPSTFYSISQEPKLWDASSNGAWGTNLNWTPVGAPSSLQDVIIPNPVPARQPTLNTSVDIGALWIQNGATLNLGANSRTLGIAFDVLNCGVITGSLGVMRLNTTTIQTQHISGTGTYSLCDLIVNNQFVVNPSTQLNQSVTVGGVLTLTSGIVGTSTTNILALNTNATSTSGSSQSFVSGPMSKTGTADFVFPVGKGQEWRRIRVSSISASTTFRAEYFTNPYSSTTPVTAPLNNVSQIEFWQLDRTVGSGNAFVSLYWENVAYSGIDNCPDLEIARWNGSTWVRLDATTVAGSSCSGSGTGTIITNAIVTAFSPFTFGSTSATVNALPIELTSFVSECDAAGAHLKWTTQTEKNNAEFVVERSLDGLAYSEVGRLKGAGNSKTPQQYSLSDDMRFDAIVYYRLRMIDTYGESTFSPIISASCASAQITVFPNPSTGDFTITGLDKGAHIRVLNALGQPILDETTNGSSHSFHIASGGIYLLYLPESASAPPFKLIVR